MRCREGERKGEKLESNKSELSSKRRVVQARMRSYCIMEEVYLQYAA